MRQTSTERLLVQFIEEGSHCKDTIKPDLDHRHSSKETSKERTVSGKDMKENVGDTSDCDYLLEDNSEVEDEISLISHDTTSEVKANSEKDIDETVDIGTCEQGNDVYEVDAIGEKDETPEVITIHRNNQESMTERIHDNKDNTNPPEILSGISVSNVSETSSGPLFKTPVEPKVKTKPGLDVKVGGTRSMRTRVNKSENVPDESDDISNLTPEPGLEFVKTILEDEHKTYCRKQKVTLVPVKVLKVTQKVSEWLENVPEKHLDPGAEERPHHGKRLNKKESKIKIEEMKMGLKIKHLAEQVVLNNDDFGFDEFDSETPAVDKKETSSSSTADTVNNKPMHCCEDNVSNEISESLVENRHTFVDSIAVESDVVDSGKHITHATDIKESGNSELVEEVEVVEAEVVPVKRKRIFKTRMNRSVENCSTSESADSNTLSIDSEGTVVTKDKPPVYANAVDANHVLNQSDPFEFKSSQPTPVKPAKGKRKKNPKVTTASCKNRKTGLKKKLPVAIQIVKKSTQVWNKNSIPQKTILKSKVNLGNTTRELERLNKNLQQAEEFDLMTCTQEAAERIEIESNKKVRFCEPVIADFIDTGRINIQGYREAKAKFQQTDSEAVKREKSGVLKTKLNDTTTKDKENGNKAELELSIVADLKEKVIAVDDYEFGSDNDNPDVESGWYTEFSFSSKKLSMNDNLFNTFNRLKHEVVVIYSNYVNI